MAMLITIAVWLVVAPLAAAISKRPSWRWSMRHWTS
jgi:hypothetical protein